MSNHPSGPSPEADSDLGHRRLKHRTFGRQVTAAVIIICCLLFLGGLRISGMPVENLIWSSGLFDPAEHICLKTAWLNTTQGQADRVQLCTEWIDYSDMSGETHRLPVEDVEIIKGGDGKIRTHLPRGINYRLVAATSYLLMVIAAGIFFQQILIRRHKKQLGLTS